MVALLARTFFLSMILTSGSVVVGQEVVSQREAPEIRGTGADRERNSGNRCRSRDARFRQDGSS